MIADGRLLKAWGQSINVPAAGVAVGMLIEVTRGLLTGRSLVAAGPGTPTGSPPRP